jgi:hypothetical protein
MRTTIMTTMMIIITIMTNKFISIHYVLINNTQIQNKYTKSKDKAVPFQAWTGPEGSRSLRLPDFKTVGT